MLKQNLWAVVVKKRPSVIHKVFESREDARREKRELNAAEAKRWTIARYKVTGEVR